MTTTKDNHAEQNARGWSETIVAMVAALECDYERLNELREMDAADMDESERKELEELEPFGQIEGDKMDDADQVRERIAESALSVQVRGGWYSPGGDGDRGEPEEFEILLTTGGPALRIMGELDEHKQPRRAWLEYQDWGTGWTEFHGEGAASQAVLLQFCSCFYFGE